MLETIRDMLKYVDDPIAFLDAHHVEYEIGEMFDPLLKHLLKVSIKDGDNIYTICLRRELFDKE
jgi:hypothetical protein